MKHTKSIDILAILSTVMVVLAIGGVASAHNTQPNIVKGNAPSSCQTVEGKNGSYTNLLAPNSLSVGQCLVDNSYGLVMQSDGNLVLYDKAINSRQQAIWTSNTSASGAIQAVMQFDGNFVLYSRSGKPIWASNTSQYKIRCRNECMLELTYCGALRIIAPSQEFIWQVVNIKNC